VNLWFEKPAPRKTFRSRKGGSVTGALSELGLGLGWAVSAAMLAAQTVWVLIPVAATLAAMAILRAFADPDQAY